MADANLEERLSALEAALEEVRRRASELTSAVERRAPQDAADAPDDPLVWQALYEGLPDPLLTIDAAGVVLACNRTGLEWLDLSAADVIGRPMGALFQEGSRSEVEQLVAAGWTWAPERRFTLVDGRLVGLNAVPAPGSPARWHVTIHDLTARAVLDEAADQRRRMEALADLAGAIARELNDPMSIVQGRLELLLDVGPTDADTMRRHLEVALEHARRISATLRNLRLVGRTSVPKTEPVFLAEAVDEALELVGPRARQVSVELRPPDVATSGESAMYARVLANLVRRALDLSPRQGRVELKCRNDRNQVVVRVTTRGRLRDGGEVPSRQSFSIDETLLASVGGRLEIEAGPAEVVFTLILPPAPRQRVRARPVEERLLVVGSEVFRSHVEALLVKEGFAILGTPTGEGALQVLESEASVDAVVAELLLDGMSGLGLAETVLRDHPGLRGRILVVSNTRIDNAPPSVVPLCEPLRRRTLLEALGRRVR